MPPLDIPETFWTCLPLPSGRQVDRIDVAGKMVNIEEMTECSFGNEMDETDGGEYTIDEGTEKPSFRVGEGIALALASRKLSGW